MTLAEACLSTDSRSKVVVGRWGSFGTPCIYPLLHYNTQNIFKNVQNTGFYEDGDLILICRLNIYLSISAYPITLTQYELNN